MKVELMRVIETRVETIETGCKLISTISCRNNTLSGIDTPGSHTQIIACFSDLIYIIGNLREVHYLP